MGNQKEMRKRPREFNIYLYMDLISLRQRYRYYFILPFLH